MTLLAVAGAALAAVVVRAAEPPPPTDAVGLAERLARADRPGALSGSFEWENGLVPAGLAEGDGERHALSPLLTGGRGRFWLSAGEGIRVELQGRTGDALLVADTRTLWLYDGSARTAERVALPEDRRDDDDRGREDPPSRSEIERGLERLERKATLDGPDPSVEADRPAYSFTATPRDSGGMLDAVRGALDAETGLPLRLEVLAEGSGDPVASARVGELTIGPVDRERFEFTPPPGTRVTESELGEKRRGRSRGDGGREDPATTLRAARRRAAFPVDAPDRVADLRLTEVRGARRGLALRYGEGAGATWVLQSASRPGAEREEGERPELRGPTVDLPGARAQLFETPLGSALVWRSGGVRRVVAASRPAREVVAAARAVAGR